MDEFITKKDSKIIKCFAICLMVFHHLFAFPERIYVNYIMPFDFNKFHFETMLAYFGRICIPLFVFVSGYGMSKKYFANKNISIAEQFKLCLKKLLRFYCMYWIVMLITLPYGFFTGIYHFELLDFVKNLLGFNCTFNKEWWYVFFYIKLVILFPIIVRIMNYILNKSRNITIVLLICLSICTFFSNNEFSYWIIILYSITIVRFSLFDRMSHLLKNNKFIYFIGLILCFFCRTYSPYNIDFIISIILIFCIVSINHKFKMNSLINSMFVKIGNYSIYIWLTHSFFCYYYFQKFLYNFRISWVIFAVCIILCYILGIILDMIYKKVVKIINFSY